MAEQPHENEQLQGNVMGPPILMIPNELVWHIESHLENPCDLAHFAATNRRMWEFFGVNDGIHTREARFWKRLRRENRQAEQDELNEDRDVRQEIENLRVANDPEGADALEEQRRARDYTRMRAAWAYLQARPPTLLLAIQRGCSVPFIRRLLALYRREMSRTDAIVGHWGVSRHHGPNPTTTAVRAGRVDVLRLLTAENAFIDDPERQALVSHVELQGNQRHQAWMPIEVAVWEWQDNSAEYILKEAGRSQSTPLLMSMAVRAGAAAMLYILVPAWAQLNQQNAHQFSAMMAALVKTAAWQIDDRRYVIEALIGHGGLATLSEGNLNYADQLLPWAVQHEGGLVNVGYLMTQLVANGMLSRDSFARVAEEAALVYPDHGFLRVAIPHAIVLAPAGIYTVAACRQLGLEILLQIELTQARPDADPALRTVGVGLLLAAGLRLQPADLGVGSNLPAAEAADLISYLARRRCPLDPPPGLRPRHDHGQGATLHPLRYLGCVLRNPRAVMCLIAHGARLAKPEEGNWVLDAIWLCWLNVFNDLESPYWAQRAAMIRACQSDQFPINLAIFDNPDPSPDLFARQVLTLYLAVYQPPIWNRHRYLTRGEFIPRRHWPSRLFDINYYS